jgi:hypothetical protein
MTPLQTAAIEMAVIDLAHAIKAQRDCVMMDEQALLYTIRDIGDAFPEFSDQVDHVLRELQRDVGIEPV